MSQSGRISCVGVIGVLGGSGLLILGIFMFMREDVVAGGVVIVMSLLLFAAANATRAPGPKCPSCGGAIEPGYPKCKHCGSDLPIRMSAR